MASSISLRMQPALSINTKLQTIPNRHSLPLLPRPDTPATEISDSEWREAASDSGSDFEEDLEGDFFGIVNGTSDTSESPLDEISTPVPAANTSPLVQIRRPTSIQGPSGPHLFRHSFDSAKGFTFEHALQLSPLFPKTLPAVAPLLFQSPVQSPVEEIRKPFTGLKSAVAELNSSEVETWTARDVASWMFSAGFEESVIQKFEEHDICGSVLLEMQMQDLKELDIASFGKRHQIWKEICALREDGAGSPAPTCIEDSSRPGSRNANVRDRSRSRRRAGQGSHESDRSKPSIHGSKKRRNRRKVNPTNDPILPAESVSIVAIEQLLPKQHRCSKGENCSKWKKQQRMRSQLDQEFGLVSPDEGACFIIAGDPGNPQSATSLVNNMFRPISAVVPSVVASSDVLGPTQLPKWSLQEDTLQGIETCDPQESVKKFLEFQHLQSPIEIPQLPLEDIFDAEAAAPVSLPPHLAPHSNLQQLPRLSIPRSASADPWHLASMSLTEDSPATAARSMYRLGTPASDMDVSRPQLDLTPYPRDASSSVPPNMYFRDPIQHRPGSRDPSSWRRHSLALPTLLENSTLGTPYLSSVLEQPQPKATPESTYGEGTTHAGWMAKRKAKLLRHEWSRSHYRLNGTQLAMHTSARGTDKKALEVIDVDDYFVSCSSRTGNSKLASALKALHISGGSKDNGPPEAPFGFQLVPATDKSWRAKAARELRTHNFAVSGKEERVDWMREVMLAKALKQKSDGFQVTVNGQVM